MQDPDHQKAKCAKCGAAKLAPCRNLDGGLSEHVHHGRPYWSTVADRKSFKMRGGSLEILFDDLLEFKILNLPLQSSEKVVLQPRPAPPIPRGIPVAVPREPKPCQRCGAGARPYMNGWLCEVHAPKQPYDTEGNQ